MQRIYTSFLPKIVLTAIISAAYFSIEATASPLLEVREPDLISNKQSNKQSAQTLTGTWTKEILDFDSGETIQHTIFYNTDGSYEHYVTRANGIWYEIGTGTWQLNNGVLSEQSQTGKTFQGSVKFNSDNEFYYNNNEENSLVNGKWSRATQANRISTDELVGTWSLKELKDYGNGKLSESLELNNQFSVKLLELNSDGTFRYKDTDGSFATTGITTSTVNGTWKLIDSGLADGVLLLKDTNGRAISGGALHKTADGTLIQIHRSVLDLSKNQLSGGRIEKLTPSDLDIDS